MSLRDLTADVASVAAGLLAPGRYTRLAAANELARIARAVNVEAGSPWTEADMDLLLARVKAA